MLPVDQIRSSVISSQAMMNSQDALYHMLKTAEDNTAENLCFNGLERWCEGSGTTICEAEMTKIQLLHDCVGFSNVWL